MEFETKTNLENLSPDSIISMLYEVKKDIAEYDLFAEHAPIKNILKIAEKGEYKINSQPPIIIDFSSAKTIIDTYKRFSTGGCKSCINLKINVINVSDATIKKSCQVYDTQNSKDNYSKKVEKHYEEPCETWKPRFSKTIEELVKIEDEKG